MRAKKSTVRPIHEMFKACSDPTRLRILNMLRNGEICVCDLTGILGVSQPKASRHLACLRRSGLVSTRKQGLWIYYSLASAPSHAHRKLLAAVAACAPLDRRLAKDIRKVGALKRRPKCC